MSNKGLSYRLTIPVLLERIEIREDQKHAALNKMTDIEIEEFREDVIANLATIGITKDNTPEFDDVVADDQASFCELYDQCAQ